MLLISLYLLNLSLKIDILLLKELLFLVCVTHQALVVTDQLYKDVNLLLKIANLLLIVRRILGASLNDLLDALPLNLDSV